MSEHQLPEQVHRAVRDDVTAFAPVRTPPFAALQARKRRRDVLRAGSLLGLTAFGVAAVAVVPAALTRGTAPGSPGLASRPGWNLPQQRLTIDFAPGTTFSDEQQGRQATACSELPGASEGFVMQSLPPHYGVKVTGAEQIAAVRACFERIDGAVVSAVEASRPGTPSGAPVLTAQQQAFVDACVGQENAAPAPQYVGMAEAQANPADSYRPYPTRVVGRDGECLGRTNDLRGDRVDLIVESGRVIWAGRF